MTRFSPRRNTRQSGRRRGNAVLEAALVLPILLALSFGTVEFGHFFYVKHTMQGAARDGARVAILPGATNTKVLAAVDQTMVSAGFINPPGSPIYTTTITNGQYGTTIGDVGHSSVTTGTPIKVTVTAKWEKIGLRPMNMIDKNKDVIGFTIMVKE
jgi:Flp pilus assembly protein TadG